MFPGFSDIVSSSSSSSSYPPEVFIGQRHTQKNPHDCVDGCEDVGYLPPHVGGCEDVGYLHTS